MELLKTTRRYDAAVASAAGVSSRVAPLSSLSGCDWVSVQRDCWAWAIRSDWEDSFSAKDFPDFLNLSQDHRASLVKSNDGRQVWRMHYAGQLLYVKVCRPARRWAACRRLLFGCDASRERRVWEYASARGIETVVPIAVATAPIRGREPISILITLGLPRAVPLNEFWERLDPAVASNRRVRNQVIDATARLIANAHQCGFEHSDLHAGNVLIEPGSGGGLRALFVDLLSVRTGRAVSDAGVVRNLAQFNQWFRLHAATADRIRFLKRYLAWRDRLQAQSEYGRSLRCDCRGLLPELERAVIEHANALYGKRDRRALRTGRYFSRLRLRDGWRANVFLEAKHPVEGSPASVARLTGDQWKTWLDRPTEWAEGVHREYVIKDSPTALVYRHHLNGQASEPPIEVVCKRSLPRHWLKRLALLIRPSRPMLTWRLANALLNRQVPTARPLAVVERRVGSCVTDAFILTEYIENAHDLDALLTIQLREMDAESARRLKNEISNALVSTLRRMHERGFTHRDLKAPNLIVQWSAESAAAARVLLVDLDGIRHVGRAQPAAEFRALARLNVSLDHCRRISLTDRVRFLRNYLVRPGCPQPDWKTAWKLIEALSGRKRAQKPQDTLA